MFHPCDEAFFFQCSYPNRVRLEKPKEFDVYFVLGFPFPLTLSLDENRSGFIHLYMSNTMKNLRNDRHYHDVYQEFYDLVDYNTGHLRRTNFQWWIHDIIERAIKNQPRSYEITYTKRAVAHNIYVRERCKPHREFGMDIVPAISFGKVSWMHFRGYPPFKNKYFTNFYAIPKKGSKMPESTGLYTYMMVNPMAERELLWRKNNLKVAYRLLKSLRDRYDLNRLKSAFITHTFLWQVRRRKGHFWRKPVSYIFLHTLHKLQQYFNNRYLPYFWVRDMNMLDILRDDEITEYAQTLKKVLTTLNSYPHQCQLTLQRTADHFDIPFEYEDADDNDDDSYKYDDDDGSYDDDDDGSYDDDDDDDDSYDDDGDDSDDYDDFYDYK